MNCLVYGFTYSTRRIIDNLTEQKIIDKKIWFADHENIQENVYRLINFNRENNWLEWNIIMRCIKKFSATFGITLIANPELNQEG